MNVYGLVILFALLFTYAVNLIADLLNLGALSRDLPGEFQGVYDAEKYRRSQEYSGTRLKFGIVFSSYELLKILLFWHFGGFNFLDEWVRGFGWMDIPAGLFYVGVLLAANELSNLPFEIYSTFVIEQHFGFNKTSPSTFFFDRLKTYALTALFGGLALAAVFYFLSWAGEASWLWVWGVGTLFLLLIQFIAPTWIMPLFNKFTPLGEGELKSAIMDYAKSVGFPLKGIFVIDGSRRSTKTNAFFTGFGENKRIALFDTLIAKHSITEMVAILAHEIGHYKMRHIYKSIFLTVAQLGLLSYLLGIFIHEPGLFAAFGMAHLSAYAGIIFFSMLYTPISFFIAILLQMYSRHNEFEADRYSVSTYNQPEALARALKTLSVSNLSNLTPHPLYAFLKYTHPPVMERLKAISDLQTVH